MRSFKRHVNEQQQRIHEAEKASNEWLKKRRRKELKEKLVSLLLLLLFGVGRGYNIV